MSERLGTWKDEQKTTHFAFPPCIMLWLFLQNIVCCQNITLINISCYEWYKQGEENWYRSVGSDDEWIKFEN
jgi:hypothetical protein